MLFRRLAGGVKLTKIDRKYTYQQVLLKENCQNFLTINTHKGLVFYTQMPLGISSTPAAFQNLVDSITADLKDIQFFSDELLTGATKEQHYNNVINLSQRLDECGQKVNKVKCSLSKEKIEYFGYFVGKEGVHQPEEAVCAIREAPRSQDIREFSRSWGV